MALEELSKGQFIAKFFVTFLGIMTIIGVITAMVFINNYFNEIIGPPQSVTHKNIDKVLPLIDYASTGKIVEKDFNKGGGISSYAWITYKIEGENTYELLKSEMESVKGANCEHVINLIEESEPLEELKRIECQMGNVKFKASTSSLEPKIVNFHIFDETNGE